MRTILNFVIIVTLGGHTMAKNQDLKQLGNKQSKDKSTISSATSKVDSLTALFMVSFLSLLSLVCIGFINALFNTFI